MLNSLEEYKAFISKSFIVDISLLPPLEILNHHNVSLNCFGHYDTVVISHEKLIEMDYVKNFKSIRSICLHKGDSQYQITGEFNELIKTKMGVKRIDKIKEYLLSLTNEDIKFIKDNIPNEVDESKLWLLTTVFGIDKQIENMPTYEGNIKYIQIPKEYTKNPFVVEYEVYINSQEIENVRSSK